MENEGSFTRDPFLLLIVKVSHSRDGKEVIKKGLRKMKKNMSFIRSQVKNLIKKEDCDLSNKFDRRGNWRTEQSWRGSNQ